MRLRALAPFVISWVSAAAALAMCAMLSSLDSCLGRGVTLDTVVRGNLHELLKLPAFWRELWLCASNPFLVPLHHVTQLCVLRAMLPIACFVAALGVLWRRRNRTDFAHAGLLCLAFATVPWFVGRFLLTGIRATEEAGQHLALMVAGLFWCSLCSLVLCGRQMFARRVPTSFTLAAATPTMSCVHYVPET